ncbi:MAG: glucosaminidase domain-containing protein [Candidatus Dormibacteria bacterium]|jgi:beta-N-acetylglucosaminidase
MGRQRSGRAKSPTRLGAAVVAALVAALCLAITPVFADTSPGSGDGGDLAAAQQALAQAQLRALQAKAEVVEATAQLDNARAQLAEAQAQLTALQEKITTLDAEVTSDQAEVSQLEAEIEHDKLQLAAFLRASYESGGSEITIEYLIDSTSISDLVARVSEVDHVANAGNVLMHQITTEEEQEQHVLAAAVLARSQAQAAEQQEATQEVIIANDEAGDAELLAADQAAATAAEDGATSAQNQYDLISEYDSEYADATEALALARADDTIFQPIAGPLFTEDTDLTVPSGENAQTIDDFLAGTALAGLGATYMQAERTYGVSAQYLVAHSIEESGWGTSAIAQSDDNLFGYGADDSDPGGDASTFPSFSACILYVAQQVKEQYLSPGGQHYHGPTLRGMNVDYASDPLWASKIAAIARTIPLPGS